MRHSLTFACDWVQFTSTKNVNISRGSLCNQAVFSSLILSLVKICCLSITNVKELNEIMTVWLLQMNRTQLVKIQNEIVTV